jgi:hypothetical protein
MHSRAGGGDLGALVVGDGDAETTSETRGVSVGVGTGD